MGFEGAVWTKIWHLGSAGSKYLLGILIYNGSVLPMFQGCGGVPGQGRGDSLWGEFHPSRLLYSTDSYFLPLVFVFHDKNQSYKYEKYSREIIFRWESCLLSIDCWSVFCLAARQIESDNQIWYKIHHCFKRRVSQNENFNISNLAVLVSTCSSRPPDFALYAATFSFSSAFMGAPVTAPLRFDISQLLG